MRAQPARPLDWRCGYCGRPIPAAVNHKCSEYGKAKDAEDDMVDPHFERFIEPLPQIHIPLIFYDSTNRRLRLTSLAETLEKNGGRVAVQNFALLVADLREIAASVDTHRDGGDVKQAPFMSGAVGESRDAQPSPDSSNA